MVSNARLDLPEPDSPVMTIRLSRGSSSDTFLRLCTRAPCTAMVVRGAGLETIGRLRIDVEECQFLDVDVALFRQAHGERNLADVPLVGKILERDAGAFNPIVAVEMIVDLSGRSGFAYFAQMFEDGFEQCGRPACDVLVGGTQSRLHRFLRLLRVEQIRVDDLKERRV